MWQARGSLHIHAAIWVDPDTIKEDAIVGTAPREEACTTREHNAYGANSCYGCGSAFCPLYESIKASDDSESKCMSPSSQVQRHKCRDKKCYGKCEEGEPKVCKYGYPREFSNKDLAKSTITGRNIYRCEKKEDQRLSPYIPLWLLAICTTKLTNQRKTTRERRFTSLTVARAGRAKQWPEKIERRA